MSKPKKEEPKKDDKVEEKKNDDDVAMKDASKESKEEKKEEKEKERDYILSVGDNDIILDQKTFTSKDLSSKNVSTSYTTSKYSIPGSLSLNKVNKNKDGLIISVLFDVVTPSKDEKDKSKIDENNTYEIKVLTQGNWLPLESNPDALTGFCRRMGLPSKYKFGDFIPDFISMYEDVRAAVLLFPSGVKAIRDFKKEQMQKLTKNKQKISDKLFYLYQHDKIGNACGTIALLHALANSGIKLEQVKNKEGKLVDSPITQFINKCNKMNYVERGWELLSATNIQEISENIAENDNNNQTNAPTKDKQEIDGHFISFILMDSDIYELDGRKKFPINHGKSNKNDFLKDCYNIVKNNFINLAKGNPNFSFLPLCIPPF